MNLLLNIRAKYCFLRANGVYYNCQQKGVDRMARNTTNISIRMDADLKAQADALFTELGMTESGKSLLPQSHHEKKHLLFWL